MSARVGRPRRDTIALVERVAEIFSEDPTLSAYAIVVLSGGRRQDVLRVVRMLRRLENRFRFSEKGMS